jgi:hypothetical protein
MYGLCGLVCELVLRRDPELASVDYLLTTAQDIAVDDSGKVYVSDSNEANFTDLYDIALKHPQTGRLFVFDPVTRTGVRTFFFGQFIVLC